MKLAVHALVAVLATFMAYEGQNSLCAFAFHEWAQV